MLNIGSAVGYLLLDTTDFKTSIQQALDDLKVFRDDTATVGDKLKATSTAMGTVGSNLTKNVTLPLAGIGAAAVDTAAEFEAGMSKVQAISGATENDMESLTDKALEMGAKTKFSAAESAEAFSYMAMAGWKTKDMLAGIEGIMNLAAASGEDLALTSDIVTDALTAFGKGAGDAGELADVLAAASANANTNVAMLGESFKYVAPVAGSLKMSMQDTALALGLMANSGIKASQAGTSLRGALTNMVKPTEQMENVMTMLNLSMENTDGSMKSLDEVLNMLRDAFRATTEEERAQNYAMEESAILASEWAGELEGLNKAEKEKYLQYTKGVDILEQLSDAEQALYAKTILGIKVTKNRQLTSEEYFTLAETVGRQAIEGLTQAEQAQYAAALFGKEAMSGMLAVINTSEKDYNKLKDAIYGSKDAAEEMSLIMMDNLKGSFEQLGGAVETLMIILGNALIPTVRGVTDFITKLVEKLTQMDERTVEMVVQIGLAVAALGPFLLILSKVFSTLSSVTGVISKLGGLSGIISGISGAFSALLSPVGLVTAAIVGLIATFAVLYAKNEEFRQSVNDFATEMGERLAPALQMLNESFENFKQTLTDAFMSIGTALEEARPALEFFGELIGAYVINYIQDLINWVNALVLGFASLVDIIGQAVEALAPLVNAIISLVTGDLESFHQYMRDFWNELWNLITVIGDEIIQFITSLFPQLGEIIGTNLEEFKLKIQEFFANIPIWIEELKAFILAWLDELPYTIGFYLGVFLQNVIDFFANVITSLTEWVANMSKKKDEVKKAFFDELLKFLKELPRNFEKFLKEAIDKIVEAIPNIMQKGKDLMNSFWDGLKEVWNSIKEWFGGVVESVGEFLSGVSAGMASARSVASSGSHASGLAYVPYNGYRATLHEGERVLTRSEAEAYNSGGSGGNTFIFNSPESIDEYEAQRLLEETIYNIENS